MRIAEMSPEPALDFRDALGLVEPDGDLGHLVRRKIHAGHTSRSGAGKGTTTDRIRLRAGQRERVRTRLCLCGARSLSARFLENGLFLFGLVIYGIFMKPYSVMYQKNCQGIYFQIKKTE